MNDHQLTYSQDRGTRISERHLGGPNRGNHFVMGWRVACSCGWTEKAADQETAQVRGLNHQTRPKV